MAKTDGGFSQREESTPGRDNPGSNRDLIKQIKDGKWGATGRGKADTVSREELLGMSSSEESADKWWRPAGGGTVLMYSRSAPGQYG